MPSTNKLGGTTLHQGNSSQGSSARSSRDGTPSRYGDRMTNATDYERVPVEENPKGYNEVKHRVNRNGQTVCVHNGAGRTTG